MTPSLPPRSMAAPVSRRRRHLLRYLAGGGLGAIALGMVPTPAAARRRSELENLCSMFPDNSRCENYLPGVQAVDEAGAAIAVDALLPTLSPGQPVAVQGLPDVDKTYLVIESGPAIARFGIRPVCTHLGCTVNWQAEQNRFVCPCHDSQYDDQGRVVAGPANADLPLVTVITRQNQIRLVDRAPSIDPR